MCTVLNREFEHAHWWGMHHSSQAVPVWEPWEKRIVRKMRDVPLSSEHMIWPTVSFAMKQVCCPLQCNHWLCEPFFGCCLTQAKQEMHQMPQNGPRVPWNTNKDTRSHGKQWRSSCYHGNGWKWRGEKTNHTCSMLNVTSTNEPLRLPRLQTTTTTCASSSIQEESQQPIWQGFCKICEGFFFQKKWMGGKCGKMAKPTDCCCFFSKKSWMKLQKQWMTTCIHQL